MQSENVYIGDDKFQRLLDHYNCPAPLGVVKLRFAGAVCSPNPNLRPTDVIASLFAENLQPRLTTKNEAELFFKFFMGLWDEMFVEIKTNTLKLPEFSGNKNDTKELAELCHSRADQIEFGFVEGFWGGCETLSIPNYAAELMAFRHGRRLRRFGQKTDTGGKSERHLPGYSEHGSDGGKDFSLFD